jgi:hypothetical protein
MNVEIGTEAPRNSFSDNIYFGFSVLCLCSVGSNHGQDISVSSALVEEMTLVKSLHSGDPDVIQAQGLASL